MRYPLWKRGIDVFGALAGLFIILPLAPFIAIAIKLDTPGPVIEKLERVSEGKVVRVYKFRSMIKDAHSKQYEFRHLNERTEPFFKIKDDPRLTKTGRRIRKYRIDEFPQLVNVLKGELALVGPRPHEPGEVEKYPDEHKHIVQARAGATGLSQVSGASSLPFLKELELDRHYIDNMSWSLDAKIIGKTIAILFFDPTAV